MRERYSEIQQEDFKVLINLFIISSSELCVGRHLMASRDYARCTQNAYVRRDGNLIIDAYDTCVEAA
jgi:hypothetical protein